MDQITATSELSKQLSGIPRSDAVWLVDWNDDLAAVFDVNFMVKLLRACVWMPWLKQAMKDVANCDKPRGEVSIL